MSMSIKPLRLTMQLRNNILIRLREEMGMSQREFSSRFGLGTAAYNSMETLRYTPLRQPKMGQKVRQSRRNESIVWKDSALRLARVHGLSPEELWPSVVLAVGKNKSTTEVTEAQAMRLLLSTPAEPMQIAEDALLEQERLTELNRWLSRLPSRLALALSLRYGLDGREPHTLDEAGEVLGLSRERTRQLEQRGLKRIRIMQKEDEATSIIILSKGRV